MFFAHKNMVQTCLERYGVENPFAATEVKQKIEATKLERYGDSHYTNINQIKETITKLKQDDPTWLQKRNQKYQETCLERYGTKNSSQNEKVRQKIIQNRSKALYDKYGCNSAGLIKSVQLKIQKTVEERYGVKWSILLASRKKLQFNSETFDSIPELAYYIWLTDHHIQFTYHPTLSFPYIHQNKTHYYCPDFLVEQKIVEIKGPQFINNDGTWRDPYVKIDTGCTEAKHQCLISMGVKIIFKDEYQTFIDYVNMKYGDNFLQSCRKTT